MGAPISSRPYVPNLTANPDFNVAAAEKDGMDYKKPTIQYVEASPQYLPEWHRPNSFIVLEFALFRRLLML